MNTGLAGLFRLDRGRAPGNVVHVFADFMNPRLRLQSLRRIRIRHSSWRKIPRACRLILP